MTDHSAGIPARAGRRWPWVVGGLVVLVALAVGVAVLAVGRLDRPAEVPSDFRAPTALPASTPLPDDDLAFDSDRTGNFEIFAGPPDNPSPRQLTDDPRYDSWWPRISPDRRTILFHRSPKGTHDRDFARVSLWAMAADGTGVVELRPAGLDGWTVQGHVEWSPSGDRLVMFGGSRLSPQIWTTDPTGRDPRQLTDRGGRNLDPSYSTDGSGIWFVGCPKSFCQDADQEIYRIDVGGDGKPSGDPERMTDDDLRDNDPYESPDGTRLGWLTQFGTSGIGVWDIRIAEIDTSSGSLGKARRLVDDSAVTSRPQWSADTSTITTHRLEPGSSAFDLVRIDVATGTVTRLAASSSANDEYPSL